MTTNEFKDAVADAVIGINKEHMRTHGLLALLRAQRWTRGGSRGRSTFACLARVQRRVFD